MIVNSHGLEVRKCKVLELQLPSEVTSEKNTSFHRKSQVLFDRWKTDNSILGELLTVYKKNIRISEAALKAAEENY